MEEWSITDSSVHCHLASSSVFCVGMFVYLHICVLVCMCVHVGLGTRLCGCGLTCVWLCRICIYVHVSARLCALQCLAQLYLLLVTLSLVPRHIIAYRSIINSRCTCSHVLVGPSSFFEQ